MLQSTFLHLPGIGKKKERELWRLGIKSWDDYEKIYLSQRSLFSDQAQTPQQTALEESRCALETGNAGYFARKLPHSEHYRIALQFPSQVAFLDIETTGLSSYYDEVTVIGAALDGRYQCHIKGAATGHIRKALASAKCLITFNGLRFDTKFLAAHFPDLELPSAHVDLYWLGKRFGLNGGQKSIEQDIGLKRDADLTGMVGEDAPLLWYEYRLGDREAGKRLLEYNCADIHGMQVIFSEILTRMRDQDRELAKILKPFREPKKLKQPSFTLKKDINRSNQIYVPPVKGSKGPKITLNGLLSQEEIKRLTIVGIDLTGAEKRASGFCILEGSTASTKLIKTDAELISECVRAKPTLVSIDSPLSLPFGRTSVTDDDPKRDEIGIMRQCERELKRRGVNVYPSLLPSMQQLTARGIRLAAALRSQGIPVIESYPGAAQDIMNIPRKQKGLHYLKKALHDFGISGDFVLNTVSHDEVDAITSAVVGQFFWSGRFEGLGNENEDRLVIPDLRRSPDDWRNRVVIGLSGPIAAGKTTAGDYLKGKGFAYGRFSLVLKRLLEAEGRPVNRKTLQEIGEKINIFPGQIWLCKQLIGELRQNPRIAVDGLRFPQDHACLVEAFGPAFNHIFVDAPLSIRRARSQAKGVTGREFDESIQHPVEKSVPTLAGLAQNIIRNDGSVRGFQKQLNAIIS